MKTMNKRKVALLCLGLFLNVYHVLAQDVEQTSRKGIYVSPMLSIGIGSATGEDFIEGISEGADNIEVGYPAYAIGVHAGYMFTNNLGVMTGFNIRQYPDDPSLYTNDVSGMRKDFEVPFYGRYISSKPGRLGFFANLGFIPAFMIANGGADYTGSSFFSDYSNNGGGYTYNAFNFSIGMHVGFNIPMGKIGNIDLGPEFQSGLLYAGAYHSWNFNNYYAYDTYNVRTAYVGLRAQCNIKVTR